MWPVFVFRAVVSCDHLLACRIQYKNHPTCVKMAAIQYLGCKSEIQRSFRDSESKFRRSRSRFRRRKSAVFGIWILDSWSLFCIQVSPKGLKKSWNLCSCYSLCGIFFAFSDFQCVILGCHWNGWENFTQQRREDTQQMVGLVGVAAGSATAMMTAGGANGSLGIVCLGTYLGNHYRQLTVDWCMFLEPFKWDMTSFYSCFLERTTSLFFLWQNLWFILSWQWQGAFFPKLARAQTGLGNDLLTPIFFIMVC